MAEFHEFDAREYKLLLDPAQFDDRPATREMLSHALIEVSRGAAVGRAKGDWRGDGLEKCLRRTVCYWDTPGYLFYRGDYTLRSRTKAGEPDAGETEITLKLRTPDLFVSATGATPDGAKVKFEEDIAPLEVQGGAGGRVVLATPLSIRSRFSLSSSLQISRRRRPGTVGDALELYPSLRDVVGRDVAAEDRLLSRRTIHESCWRGLELDLGCGVAAGFSLTLWRFDLSASTDVAEISFTCRIKDHRMAAEPARRAYAMFIGMQETLRQYVNVADASKTALALGIPG